MKASELIERLEELMEKNGDVPVYRKSPNEEIQQVYAQPDKIELSTIPIDGGS